MSSRKQSKKGGYRKAGKAAAAGEMPGGGMDQPAPEGLTEMPTGGEMSAPGDARFGVSQGGAMSGAEQGMAGGLMPGEGRLVPPGEREGEMPGGGMMTG